MGVKALQGCFNNGHWPLRPSHESLVHIPSASLVLWPSLFGKGPKWAQSIHLTVCCPVVELVLLSMTGSYTKSWRLSTGNVELRYRESRNKRIGPDPSSVQRMFDRIASTYDVGNVIISLGLDTYWRKRLIKEAGLKEGQFVLDLGTGTGKLAHLAQKKGANIVAIDLSWGMLGKAVKSYNEEPIIWLRADCLRLPFKDNTFDRTISAFVLRNVTDLEAFIYEQQRVLKPGGILLAMDTVPPEQEGVFSRLFALYLYRVIPLMGKLIAKDRPAYEYLGESTRYFLRPQEMVSILKGCGLKEAKCYLLTLGTMALYYGVKAD